MGLPFIRSKKFTQGRAGHKVRLIVIHTMETPESFGRAKQVANWFAGATAPDASAHYCIDNKDVINTVKEEDTAWAVGQYDINQASISIELAGSASQTSSQWKDAYSMAELQLAAKLCAQLCKKYNIPVVKLPALSLKTGTGLVGHMDVTTAYAIQGGHTDPGKNFPWVDFINMVKKESSLLGGK